MYKHDLPKVLRSNSLTLLSLLLCTNLAFGQLDQDNDGVTDDLDAFPNDPSYWQDTDNDGLPDRWEIQYPNSTEPGDDIDGDGLSNLEEYLSRTNPNNTDTDNDGYSDAEEVINGTLPHSADSDNDGLNDAEEIALDLNPTQRDSDNNGTIDGFELGQIINVSSSNDNFISQQLGTGRNLGAVLSADGRYVLFASEARAISGTRYIEDDDEPGLEQLFESDLYFHDTYTGETTLISRALDGSPANGTNGTRPRQESASLNWQNRRNTGFDMSDDGRFVVFMSNASNLTADNISNYQIYLYDRVDNTIELISRNYDDAPLSGHSYYPSMSSDGRYISYASSTTDFSSPSNVNNFVNIYLYDRIENNTIRVSTNSQGLWPNADVFFSYVSDDGNYVTFETNANNLVSGDTNGTEVLDSNGLPAGIDGGVDIFVHEVSTDITERITVSLYGEQASEEVNVFGISGDGNTILFSTRATELAEIAFDTIPVDRNEYEDVYVYYRDTQETELVSVAYNSSYAASGDSRAQGISTDGNYVLFSSSASDLVSDDNSGLNRQAYLRNLITGETQLISQANDGDPAYQNSGDLRMAISADVQFIAFNSLDTTLTPHAESESYNVYVMQTGIRRLVEQTLSLNTDSLSEDRGAININFLDYDLLSYSGDRPDSGSVSIEDEGATLRMQGNRWQTIALTYEVTPFTILELDYAVEVEAEIQGIGFDTNTLLSGLFRFSGTQNYGSDAYQYTGSGEYQRFVINAGDFLSGEYNYLFFANDDDANVGGEIRFSNISIYESNTIVGLYYEVREGETWESLAEALYGNSAAVESVREFVGQEFELIPGARIPAEEMPETVTAYIEENRAPEVEDAQFTTDEDSTLNTILPTAIDDDGEVVSYNLLSSVSEGNLILSQDGTFSFVPGEAFNTLTTDDSRQVTFTYSATDDYGDTSEAATVTILVTGVNDAPTTLNDILATFQNTDLFINAETLLSNDNDVETPENLSVIQVSNSVNGEATLNTATQTIIFTPNAGFFGEASFDYVITDGENTATATVTLNVEEVDEENRINLMTDYFIRSSLLNFNDYELVSYSVDNPENGTVTVSEDGRTLRMLGNRWQAIALPYTITPNTILEFDFRVTTVAEIQGISFDTDTILSGVFRIAGDQSFGSDAYRYTGDGEYQHFIITVGDFLLGDFNYMFFANDDDANVGGDIEFRNIQLYEPDALVIDAYYEVPEGMTWSQLAELFYGTQAVADLLQAVLENSYDLEEGTQLLQRDFPESFVLQP